MVVYYLTYCFNFLFIMFKITCYIVILSNLLVKKYIFWLIDYLTYSYHPKEVKYGELFLRPTAHDFSIY